MKASHTISAREIALQALLQWEGKGFEIRQTLDSLLTDAVSENEKALSYELSMGIVRWKLTLDEALKQCSKRGLSTISREIRNIIRLGLYQLIFLDRIPAHAAVNESVKLAKKHSKGDAYNFVNAVLREFLRRNQQIVFPQNDPIQNISLSMSYPVELVRRWAELWGLEKARMLCQLGNQPPRISLRVNFLKITRIDLIKRLRDGGIEAVESPGQPNAVRIEKSGSLLSLAAFQEGLFQVQDEAMLKIIDYLDLKSGLCVLDLCSAPGTKSTAVAEALKNQGRVISLDRSFMRLKTLLGNLQRLGIQCVYPVVSDARSAGKIFRRTFERILVDAPCSNSGVLSKRVEARWRYSIKELKRLSILQSEILGSALNVLKEGGILVYSTCSIDPVENEEVVRSVLEINPQYSLVAQDTLFPTPYHGGGYWAKVVARC